MRKAKKNAPATVAKIVTYFRAAVRKAVRARKIPASVEWCFDDIKIGQLIGDINKFLKFMLSPAQYRALLDNAPNEKYRAIFTIYVHTALRKSELKNAKWEDVNFETGIFTVRADNSKTHEMREVPLNKYAIEALKSLGGKGWFGMILGYSQKSFGMKELAQACEKAGPPFGSNRGRVGYHTFRHSWISNAENEAGVNQNWSRAISGHRPNKKDAHYNYMRIKMEHKARGMAIWTQWWDEKVIPQKIDNPLTQPAEPKIKVANLNDYR